MKKAIFLMTFIGLFMTSCSAQEKVISFAELPATAKTFIADYFSNETTSYVMQDGYPTEYKVVFTSGTKIEFDKNGNWTEVDAGKSALPDGIIPQQIKEQIVQRFPDVLICKIEKDKNTTEVKLSNGLDVKFNSAYQIIEIDD